MIAPATYTLHVCFSLCMRERGSEGTKEKKAYLFRTTIENSIALFENIMNAHLPVSDDGERLKI